MLHTLRKKSEHTRMILAIVLAVVITSVVVVFWIWSTTGRFSESKEQVQDGMKPFGVLRESLGGFVQDYKEDRAIFKAEQEANFELILEEDLGDTSDDVFDEEASLNELYGFDIEQDGDDSVNIEVTEDELSETETTGNNEDSSTE
jgi:hypothetical protein